MASSGAPSEPGPDHHSGDEHDGPVDECQLCGQKFGEQDNEAWQNESEP